MIDPSHIFLVPSVNDVICRPRAPRFPGDMGRPYSAMRE